MFAWYHDKISAAIQSVLNEELAKWDIPVHSHDHRHRHPTTQGMHTQKDSRTFFLEVVCRASYFESKLSSIIVLKN